MLRAVGLTVTLTLWIFCAPLLAVAETPKKVFRIGLLIPAEPDQVRGPLDAFRQELRKLGHVEGQSLTIDYRYAVAGDRLRSYAAELVRLDPDVIVTVALLATKAAMAATTSKPIVFTAIADPVGDGLVASLARPGGNLTGLTHIPNELYAKQLELLKETVPGVLRVVVLWNPEYSPHREALERLTTAAKALRVELQPIEFRHPKDFEGERFITAKGGGTGLLALGHQLTYAHRTRLAQLALKNRLPTVGLYREFAEVGGLISYGSSIPDMFRRAATYVDKILKGAKPADLPVEQPTRFELVINLKTAKALGLTIPHSVLFRADQVIE